MNYYHILKYYILKWYFSLFPLHKFYIDQKNKHNNYRFFNFAEDINPKTFWIKRFIEERNINPMGKKIDFFSVFWPRRAMDFSQNIKIFFTWEHISEHRYKEYNDYCLNTVDLSLGFREYSNNNYLRLPLYIFSLINPNFTNKEIRDYVVDVNKKRNNFPEKFCTLIARHDMAGDRIQAYNILKEIGGNIDCPSLLLNNMNIYLPDYESKRKFLEQYKFNICLENIPEKWYITEKLVDAVVSKSIPIYNWVFTDFEERIFNKDFIIFLTDGMEEYWKIKQLNNNIKIYKEFTLIPPLKKSAWDTIIELFENLKEKLSYVLK